MTRIEWMELQDICYIRAEGHAGYEPGRDIVCAAVSALLQTLYAGLDSICHAETVKREKDGMMVIEAYAGKYNRKETHALFQGILCGLQLIAREYPENVQVEHILPETMQRCREGADLFWIV